LKEFAEAACLSPDHASIAGYMLSGPYDFSHREYDDSLAQSSAAGMGECPRQFFLQLISIVRSGRAIDRQWIQRTVAANTRAPIESGGRVAPPANRGKDCFKGGNPFGCQPR